jgi:hypothetical protein
MNRSELTHIKDDIIAVDSCLASFVAGISAEGALLVNSLGERSTFNRFNS